MRTLSFVVTGGPTLHAGTRGRFRQLRGGLNLPWQDDFGLHSVSRVEPDKDVAPDYSTSVVRNTRLTR